MDFRLRRQARATLDEATFSTFEVAGDDGTNTKVVADGLTPDGDESVIGHIETIDSNGQTRSFIGRLTRRVMEAGKVEIEEIIHPSDEGGNRNKFIAGVVIAGAVVVGSLSVWHNKDH